MGAAFVSGAQNHVLASPKHFALNNLENTRFEVTADVDPRALREVYLPHFERCVVEAGAASVMSAYNKVNGTYCGENEELLDEILRGDWGFRGFVESDWFLGARSTAEAIRAGLDIEMPAPFRFSDENLEAALESGAIDETVIHRNARRSVYQKIAWQLREDGVAGQGRPEASVVECPEHVALAREAAEKSIVLLKNEGEVLPLSRAAGTKIAVVGDLAGQANLGDRGSSMVHPSRVTTPLQGIQAHRGDAEIVHLSSAADLSALADFDVAVVVAGLTYRDEGEFIPMAQKEAEGSDLARGGDRADLALPEDQRDLVARAAAAARRTVVVLQGGSAIVVRDWVDDVEGLLMAWYGGREGGHGLARVLFGDVSPSGRLPVSIPRDMGQLMPWDVTALRVEHDLLHGYRWLDHHGHTPEFPFGFGLGYATFELEALRVARAGEGFRCRVDVRNTGDRAGATVVQLYVSCRDSAVFRVEKELRGFGRVALEPGEAVTLEIALPDRDLRTYDADARAWKLEACRYVLRAGQSSHDLPLETEWVYEGGDWRER
jgi:beta-glucosidase